MVHDGRGNLTAVIDVDGSAMRITYDDADRAVRVVSKSGAEWRYDFDDVTGDLLAPPRPRRAVAVVDLGRARAGRSTDTDRTGAITTFEYEGVHRTPITGRSGPTAARRRPSSTTPAGRTRITDADGVVRQLEWDRDGQLIASHRRPRRDDHVRVRRRRPAGPARRRRRRRHAARLRARARGRAASVATRCGEYPHTPAGRINGGIEPGDLPWSATFGPHGAMETITDALGSTAALRVRLARRRHRRHRARRCGVPQRVRRGRTPDRRHRSDGATLRKGYDVEGRLVEFIDPDGRVDASSARRARPHRPLDRPRRRGHRLDLPPQRRGRDRHRPRRPRLDDRDRRVRPDRRRHRSDRRPRHPRLQRRPAVCCRGRARPVAPNEFEYDAGRPLRRRRRCRRRPSRAATRRAGPGHRHRQRDRRRCGRRDGRRRAERRRSRDDLGRAPPHGRLPHRVTARPGSSAIRPGRLLGAIDPTGVRARSTTGTSAACCARRPMRPAG